MEVYKLTWSTIIFGKSDLIEWNEVDTKNTIDHAKEQSKLIGVEKIG